MRFSVYVLISFLLAGCASLPEVAEGVHVSEHQKVTVGWGPEDFDLDQSKSVDYPRLLVACDERREGETQGEIWEVNLTDFSSRKLDIVFKDSTNFHPHGISVYRDKLFVISHNEKKDEFYRFRIEGDKVVEEKVYSENLIGHGNDLFAVGDDEFFYSDFKMFNGKLIYCLGGECDVVAKHLKYPNGVYVLGDAIYVTTTLQNKVYAFDDDFNEKKIMIAKVKGGDNLMYDGRNLYTTSHPRFGKFIKHYKHSEKKSPSVVYEISLQGNRVIYSDEGGQVSAASTAWRYEDYLIIGQVFDNFLWVGKIE